MIDYQSEMVDCEARSLSVIKNILGILTEVHPE